MAQRREPIARPRLLLGERGLAASNRYLVAGSTGASLQLPG
jgi:hypothetical protein